MVVKRQFSESIKIGTKVYLEFTIKKSFVIRMSVRVMVGSMILMWSRASLILVNIPETSPSRTRITQLCRLANKKALKCSSVLMKQSSISKILITWSFQQHSKEQYVTFVAKRAIRQWCQTGFRKLFVTWPISPIGSGRLYSNGFSYCIPFWINFMSTKSLLYFCFIEENTELICD